VDIEELSRKQKLSIEKVELSQTAECKAFNKKLRIEQVCFILYGFYIKLAGFITLDRIFTVFFVVFNVK